MTDKPETRINWNAYYQKEHEIHRFVPEHDCYELHRTNFAISMLPKTRIESILDVGCGDGFLCSRLKQHCIPDVHGADISSERLKYAAEAFPSIEYHQANIYNLPFKDNSFDVVTCIEVIEHAEEPRAAVEELKRVSKQYVIITVPYDQNISKVMCPHCLKHFNVDGHLHSFTEETVIQLCESTRLEIVKSKGYFLPIPTGYSLLKHTIRMGILGFQEVLARCGLVEKRKPKYWGVLCKK